MFWHSYRDALAARTPAEIAQDQAELERWESTLTDGLEPEDWTDHDPTAR